MRRVLEVRAARRTLPVDANAWPASEPAPTKYFLSSVPEDASLKDLVGLVKDRWRIERDYQQLKSELGLSH